VGEGIDGFREGIDPIDHRLDAVPLDGAVHLLEGAPMPGRNALDDCAPQHQRHGGQRDIGAAQKTDLRDAAAAGERFRRLAQIIAADQLLR
jgi:hypothetical protein